jgi:DNA-binding beta-propeller fold protein YncE
MRLRKGGIACGVALALGLMAAAGPVQVGAQANAPLAGAHTTSLQRGFINLTGSPGTPAVNPRTHTLYVPIQCPAAFCQPYTPAHELDVINTATCNAAITSDCDVIARARVAGFPTAAAVDETTDTIYTANGGGSVSVVDGALCNATVTSGCSTPLATIHTGGFDVYDVFNPITRTLYVANPQGSVFVINGARCNALTTSGCGQPVKTVTDDNGPQALDVDLATDSIYTANNGVNGNGNTVSMINGATCNGSIATGCGKAPRTVTVGSGTSFDAVDQATDTVYVTNDIDGTVSVIDGARCNSEITSGCASLPPAVSLGTGPSGVAVDDALHTVFTVNGSDDTTSAINTRTCKGTETSGCAVTPPTAQAGSNHEPGYTGFPNSITLLPHTDTAYMVNIGGESRVSVITVGTCSAETTSGCRRPALSAPASEYFVSVDAATNTIYASNLNLPEIDVLNGATCNRAQLGGCAAVAEIPMKARQANLGAIDDTTHTLYASDESGSVAVIDIATCNAQHTAGCADGVKARIPIGDYPGPPVLDAATGTLYLPYGANANRIAVANVAGCRADMTTGCAQTPAVIKAGGTVFFVAVSTKEDAIYAPIVSGDTVEVVNGATCNGEDHSGCGHIAATATVGPDPYGVAVDDATNSVYVANNNNGDGPGTLSVIDSATCNGTHTAGCVGNQPSEAIGRSPILVAVDPLTDSVYVSDYSSADVAVVDGATCNAEVTSGCRRPAPEQAVDSQPFGLAVNQSTNTVYAIDIGEGPALSIFRGRP